MKQKKYFKNFKVVKRFIASIFFFFFFLGLLTIVTQEVVYAQTTYAYVANTNSNTVSVIDLSTNTVKATISVEEYPFGVVSRFDGRFIYVTNGKSNSVSVINTTKDSVVNSIEVGEGPVEMVLSHDGRYLYITQALSENVCIIDSDNHTVVGTIDAHPGNSDTPSGIDITPDGSYLYVVNSDTTVSGVVVIDIATRTAVEEIVVGNGASGISIDNSGKKAYVCNTFDNTISVLDLTTNTVVKTLDQKDGVELAPTFVQITPDNRAWVTFTFSNSVGIFDINTDTLITTFAVNLAPTGLSFTPNRELVYVTNALSNTVMAVSTTSYSPIATISVDNAPRGIDICTVPVDPHSVYNIFIVGEERTDDVSKLLAHGHNVIYGGEDINILENADLSVYDQIWITSYRNVANINATDRLINFIKDGGNAFFIGENVGGDRPDRVEFANWRDDLLTSLGSGGVKQSNSINPDQYIYYTNIDHITSYDPNKVYEIRHTSSGNGSFENIGNGTAILTTLPNSQGSVVALAFNYMEMSEAPNSRVIVYLNSDNGKGWDLFVANIAEYLSAKDGGKLGVSNENKYSNNSLPKTFKLIQNHPNPFNPTTQIEYHIPQLTRVNISIYNSLGQKVKTLIESQQVAGFYKIQWDGTDESGSHLGAGIYVYQIRAGEYIAAKKMIMLK